VTIHTCDNGELIEEPDDLIPADILERSLRRLEWQRGYRILRLAGDQFRADL
jgi:hypothetical protein